ncbi:hypothetical protein GCM10009839_71780 [Catenulispora yoronensis]|uniref:Uncharacterized protein n=1 Tax=Catenulispora yoronensis TaxID=450799 RepID=A0ABN2V6Q9_9ACTN
MGGGVVAEGFEEPQRFLDRRGRGLVSAGTRGFRDFGHERPPDLTGHGPMVSEIPERAHLSKCGVAVELRLWNSGCGTQAVGRRTV